jgi:hypothetical protein
MFSKRKLKTLSDMMLVMDLDHIDEDEMRKLSKQWGVQVQDVELALNVAIQRKELREVEILDGGNGGETNKLTIKSVVEIFFGERKV